MVDFFADVFSSCAIMAVIALAMLPMVESKVAIPFALSAAIWGEMVLSPVAAFFAALFGSFLPCVFIVLFAKWVKSKTSGFVHDKFVVRYAKKLDKIGLQKSVFKKCLTITTFVAVPLPLTGVWTGSLIAGLTNLKIWQGLISILVGDLISCSILLLLCLVFENSVFYIFLISLAIIVLFVFINVFMWAIGKLKNRRKNREIEINCL